MLILLAVAFASLLILSVDAIECKVGYRRLLDEISATQEENEHYDTLVSFVRKSTGETKIVFSEIFRIIWKITNNSKLAITLLFLLKHNKYNFQFQNIETGLPNFRVLQGDEYERQCSKTYCQTHFVQYINHNDVTKNLSSALYNPLMSFGNCPVPPIVEISNETHDECHIDVDKTLEKSKLFENVIVITCICWDTDFCNSYEHLRGYSLSSTKMLESTYITSTTIETSTETTDSTTTSTTLMADEPTTETTITADSATKTDTQPTTQATTKTAELIPSTPSSQKSIMNSTLLDITESSISPTLMMLSKSTTFGKLEATTTSELQAQSNACWAIPLAIGVISMILCIM